MSALASFIDWLFGPRKPPSTLVRPFGRMLDAMQEKDPELYEQIRFDPVMVGRAKWREKYPEDFVPREAKQVTD